MISGYPPPAGAANRSNLDPPIELLSKLVVVNAIMDESKLPPLPPDLIEGVLPLGGKMVVQAAPKNWKTWLMILLALCVATGAKWLGLDCAQGKVLYVNLEVSEPRFLQRVYEVAKALCADAATVVQNLKIVNGLEAGATITVFVNTLLRMQGASNYSLVIIDPMYKLFDGCENEQRDVAMFFKQIDRLARGLDCSVVIVHHHSKNFQGNKDIADRSSGSGVIGRDVDAMIDLCRTDGEGKTMRASFVLREYEDKDPIDYWFKYPLCVPDEDGVLARCKPMRAHGNVGTSQRKRATVADLDEACDRLMQGKDRFKRKELVDALGYSKSGPVDNLMAKSTRFEYDTGPNYCWVVRKPGT